MTVLPYQGFRISMPDATNIRYNTLATASVFCEFCGTLLDEEPPIPRNTKYPLKYDLQRSIDGAVIASERARRLLEDIFSGELSFYSVAPSQFRIVFRKSVKLTERAQLRTEKTDFCPSCGNHEIELLGLLFRDGIEINDHEPFISSGICRTDIEFGTGSSKHPILLCNHDTPEKIKDHFPELRFRPMKIFIDSPKH